MKAKSTSIIWQLSIKTGWQFVCCVCVEKGEKETENGRKRYKRFMSIMKLPHTFDSTVYFQHQTRCKIEWKFNLRNAINADRTDNKNKMNKEFDFLAINLNKLMYFLLHTLDGGKVHFYFVVVVETTMNYSNLNFT